MKPLAIDLFAGIGGWTDGLLAEGFDVIGFDIERHSYDGHKYPAQLVLQDVLTLHGYQFRHATLIVASPPCQVYSYMAMPWTRAKDLAKWYADPDHPERIVELNTLFNACFRIQVEASEAAGRRIPMILENVRGAQPWVGRSRWNYGSYHLWGDVPALMPRSFVSRKDNPDQHNHSTKNDGGSWFRISHNTSGEIHNPVEGFKSRGLDWRRGNPGQDFTRLAGAQLLGLKGAGPSWKEVQAGKSFGHWTNPTECSGVKHNGSGAAWFDTGPASVSSKSQTRKAASAMIAKIPLPLARYIGSVFRP